MQSNPFRPSHKQKGDGKPLAFSESGTNMARNSYTYRAKVQV